MKNNTDKVITKGKKIFPAYSMCFYSGDIHLLDYYLSSGKLAIVDAVDIEDTDDLICKQGKFLFDRWDRLTPVALQRDYAFGDVAMTTALVSSIYDLYDQPTIWLLTRPQTAPLLEYNPFVALRTEAPQRSGAMKNAGIYINLNNVFEEIEEIEIVKYGKVVHNRIEIMHRYLDIEMKYKVPQYYMSEGEVLSARKYRDEIRNNIVAICPSSQRKERCYPVYHYATVINGLLSKGYFVVVLDRYIPNELRRISNKKLKQIDGVGLRFAAMWVFLADLVITSESLWCHLSAALGTPQILFASCTDGAQVTKDYGNVFSLIQGEKPCSPCWYRFPTRECVNNYAFCLDIDPQRIINLVDSFFGG